ncbi:Uncharacterised protein [uncultured archaeon]|nr:Uncharacterised protein [uncultured archaeon]
MLDYKNSLVKIRYLWIFFYFATTFLQLLLCPRHFHEKNLIFAPDCTTIPPTIVEMLQQIADVESEARLRRVC